MAQEPYLPIIIEKDSNNYYHPSTEQEIINLVEYASIKKLQVRVRGTGHSMPQAIFTDTCSTDYIDVKAKAPDGDNINIMLDKYTDCGTPNGNLVTVQAGIHLGHDPNDELSTEENSLLYQLHHKYKLGLSDLGGITHQTVAGFLSTGSSGGSTKHSVHNDVHTLRFVDGHGKIYEVSKDQEDFKGAIVSLGLLGVLSTVTFECVKKFDITGEQHGTLTHKAAVDIFDDYPEDGRIGLTKFLTETEYTRFLWWPQTHKFVDCGHHRVQIWQARRLKDDELFKKDPFELFDSTQIMMVYSFLMTLTGNIDCMKTVREKVAEKDTQFLKLAFEEIIEILKKHGVDVTKDEMKGLAAAIAFLFLKMNTEFVKLITGFIEQEKDIEKRKQHLPFFTTAAISLLNLIDRNVEFQDHSYLGLPMDNSADDIIVPVMFTEIWIPLELATAAMKILRNYFECLPGDIIKSETSSFDRTMNNAWEFYAAGPSDAWMSMSYTTGSDDWKTGAFRIDPYWFIDNNNRGDPRTLFKPVWQRLKKAKIPFRLHWGKVFPAMDDTEFTPKYLVEDQYPQLKKFLALRKLRDPNGIFLNSYWRHWLGIVG